MNKPSLIIIILEDEHHKMLIRRYLRSSGLGTRQLRIRLSPSGRGSAEAWVRKTFAEEAAVYRTRHAQTGLIAIIDADLCTVQERLDQLNQVLTDSGKPAVDRGERIARLVPKRNVETWILNLNGEVVDEEKDYKRTVRNWNHLIPVASENLNRLTRSGAEPTSRYIDSLLRGTRELKRLEL
jgi:hypothetical protein